MSRIYEALKRVERGDSPAGEPAAKPAAPPPAAPSNTLDEYPREAAITAERQKRTGQKGPGDQPTPFSGSAERIVSTAQRVDGRRAMRTDSSWRSKLATGTALSPVAINQYRRIAAALEDAQVERGVRTVMVTSALPGEGKTLTVANIGLVLSESQSRRVLLIDADLRHPSLHQVFSTPNRTGLTDMLAYEGGSLPIVEISDTLSLLPSGHTGPNPLAALTSERMSSVLEDAAHQFDWVIIDTAPVTLLPDARLLARLTRAAIMVIQAGVTPADVVERAIEEIGTNRIVGSVLNRLEQD